VYAVEKEPPWQWLYRHARVPLALSVLENKTTAAGKGIRGFDGNGEICN
jgi:hypothetical protein